MKKGQITIFIIIGLVLLFSSAIIIYIKGSIQENQVELLTAEIREVPGYAQPVNEFVSGCVSKTAEDGFTLLGYKGGYINNSHLSILSESPTDSEAIEFFQGTKIAPAYWYFLQGDNECKGHCNFETRVPPLTKQDSTAFVSSDYSIEKQVEDYISANLKTCLREFLPLTKQGFIINTSSPSTIVQINDEDVRILVDMKTKITKEDKSIEIEQYFQKLNFEFKKIYESALKLSKTEQEFGFIESITLDLINAYSGTDKNQLPPMSATEFSSNSIFWQSDNVKGNIELMLQTFINKIKILGSINEERVFSDDPTAQAIYDSMILPITGYENYGVQFEYFPIWPTYFKANSKGGMIQPEAIYEPIFQMGVQRYNTVYDLSFPVMVMMTDPFAFNNRGYQFLFALESNIRNNEHLNATFNPFEEVYLNEDSLLCDVTQRNSGEISAKLIDDKTNKGIENTKVFYTVSQESCIIGETNDKGELNTKFPVGFNGIITFEHEDYLGISEILTTRLKEPQNLGNIRLLPLKEFKIKIEKKQIKPRWTFQNEGLPLDFNETGIAKLTRIGKPGEKNHEVVFTLDGNISEKLTPGDYSVDIKLINREKLVFLPKKKCFSTLPFGIGKKCFTVPETTQTLDSVNSGGFTGNITITKRNVYDNNEVIFYAINPDLYAIPTAERIIEDMEQLDSIDSYSEYYKEELLPFFKK